MSHQGQIALPEGVAAGIATAERGDEAAAGPSWLMGVRRALAELEPVDDRARLLDRAPRALCENTLFERAIVTLVEDSSLVFVTMHMDDEVQGKLIRDLWRAEPPALGHLLIESEVVRRRRAILVQDALTHERTHRPLGRVTRTTSYVAAPLTFNGEVAGMIHADRPVTGAAVGALEREALWVFCQGLSLACERTDLMRQLNDQREEVRRHLLALGTVLSNREVPQRLGHRLADASDMELAAAGVVLAPETRIAALLTNRELEVLQLMAEGATNAEIARQLVITEGTVKSHVKHVLRKLRAGNRVAAVSRYLKIIGTEQRAN